MKARCNETLKKLIEGNVSNFEFSFLSTPPPVAIEPTDRRRTSRGGQGNAMGDGDGGDGGGEESGSGSGSARGGGGKGRKGKGANASGAGAVMDTAKKRKEIMNGECRARFLLNPSFPFLSFFLSTTPSPPPRRCTQPLVPHPFRVTQP